MSLETMVVVTLVVATAALVISAVTAVLSRSNADQQTTARIDALRADRTQMDYLERAYQEASAAQRAALDTSLGVIKAIAPHTGITTDDAAARLLEDIQQPGPLEDQPDA